MSKILWDNVEAPVKHLILEEFKILGDKSSLAIVDKMSEEYRFLKVSECPIDKKFLKGQSTMLKFGGIVFVFLNVF